MRQVTNASNQPFLSRIRPPGGILALALTAAMGLAVPALAQPDTPQYHRGACEGAYPGWLRGVVDGYNDVAVEIAVGNVSALLLRVPTPPVLTSGDERLGYGDGLKAGFTAGVRYGVQLARAARTVDPSDDQIMLAAVAEFDVYIGRHCGDLVAALDWETTFMNEAHTSTIASLNAAQVAMHLAVAANQEAIVAERSARGAREAEAKGDAPAAAAFRQAAEFSADVSVTFARSARAEAAAGREEAVQAIIDAEAAAERARKAVEDGA